MEGLNHFSSLPFASSGEVRGTQLKTRAVHRLTYGFIIGT